MLQITYDNYLQTTKFISRLLFFTVTLLIINAQSDHQQLNDQTIVIFYKHNKTYQPSDAQRRAFLNHNFVNRQTNNETKTGKELFKVLRVVPDIDQQLAFLDYLEQNDADLRLNFWTSPVRVGSAVDIMVSFEKINALKHLLENNDLHTEVIIEDVERLIIEREKKSKEQKAVYGRRFRDEIIRTSVTSKPPMEYNFHQYGSYFQIVAWMRSLANRYPNFVQFISIGKSHEGRSIDGLEIGTRGIRKRAFWIDGGIHAREWAAPHTALYFIHQLTSRYGHDANITHLVSELTWIIIPLLNPDGYVYTRTSTNPNIRLWRKNRAPTHCILDQWGRNRCCKGVDLNRNFDFHFKESGSSDDPCSEIYQGKGPFSEPETRAVRDAILSSRYRGRVDGFITLHTYSQIWIHPYGHKKNSYPGDVQDLYSVGKKATVALSKLYGTKYILGSGANTLYPASGGSEDWAKESAAIKFVYLLELRPDEKSWDGFILDETQLIPTASETWAGVKVVAEAIIQRSKNRVQPHRMEINNEQAFKEENSIEIATKENQPFVKTSVLLVSGGLSKVKRSVLKSSFL